jgi:hypothetical protein
MVRAVLRVTKAQVDRLWDHPDRADVVRAALRVAERPASALRVTLSPGPAKGVLWTGSNGRVFA